MSGEWWVSLFLVANVSRELRLDQHADMSRDHRERRVAAQYSYSDLPFSVHCSQVAQFLTPLISGDTGTS